MRDIAEIEAHLADEGVTTLLDPAPVSPHLQKLLSHWMRWCANRPLPSRQDVNPGEIRDILPALMLLEVIDGGRDYQVRIAGSGLVKVTGIEPTGKLLSQLPDAPVIGRAWCMLGMTRKAHRPVLFHSKNSVISAYTFAEVETLILPFARDASVIDHFLIGGDILLPEHLGGGSAGLVIGPARIPVGVLP